MKSRIQNKSNKKDDAVSPVVGVMLMIVVTIIIAAVVATFAGGLMNTSEPAPTTVVDAKVSSSAIMLHSLSGNEIDGSLLKVVVSTPDGTGSVSSGPLNVSGDGVFSAGEYVNAIDSFGDVTSLYKLLIPGKEVRVQLIYDNNYVLMSKNIKVTEGEPVQYFTLNLSNSETGNQKWYKSETDAVNALSQNPTVPTPEALKKISVKQNSVITVTRTGGTDDYKATPRVVNILTLSVNGQPVAWTTVNIGSVDSPNMANQISLSSGDTVTTVSFSNGYETKVLSNAYDGTKPYVVLSRNTNA